MHRGGVLPEAEIAYECWGELNSARDNAILLFTGLSPSAHAASSPDDSCPGWWEFMIGPGKPLDTDRFHVICVNSLGSCFGSTGPSSINPQTGEPYRLGFPELTVEDIAAAGRAVIKALAIPRLRAVVGASLGGMTALAYAVHYPGETDNLVTLCSAAKATPFAIAVRALQREIIRNDPAWMEGQYPPDAEPVIGMRLARKLGLISYRSAEEWDERFGRDAVMDSGRGQTFEPEFQIESYLEANAQKFVGSFDANSYLYLSRAMDWFDLEDHTERLIALAEEGAGKRALVVGVETDVLFPLHQQQSVAALLTESALDVTFHALPSLQGHDAFLVDRERVVPVMSDFFSRL
ncbi:MAG: homoserine O-acetyltransferase [Candidatus Thiodiazotropha sp.]